MVNRTTSYTLNNEHISVTVNTQGAEISSIKSNETEYLWQGNASFWNRQAPILFPIVGRLKDNTYRHNGKLYKMNQHGFARDSKFTLIAQNEDSLCFCLRASAETKKMYPFDFELNVSYRIHEKTLTVNYEVVNPDETEDLLFSIGSHPAFNCPLFPNESREDYSLVFEDHIEFIESNNLESGLVLSETRKVKLDRGELVLTPNLFDQDALVVNPNSVESVTLRNRRLNTNVWHVRFENTPFLGIWAAKNKKEVVTPFVCIEPWNGIADKLNHFSDEFGSKFGINTLAPKERFCSEYSIEII